MQFICNYKKNNPSKFGSFFYILHMIFSKIENNVFSQFCEKWIDSGGNEVNLLMQVKVKIDAIALLTVYFSGGVGVGVFAVYPHFIAIHIKSHSLKWATANYLILNINWLLLALFRNN